MSLSVMFSTMQTPPTKRSLRTVLSYFGGTSTTLFLPRIFANIDALSHKHQLAEQLFDAHFERIFSSREHEPVLLRTVPTDKGRQPNKGMCLQSNIMDPNCNEFGDSLLVLACEGGHRTVVEVLL